MQQAVGDSLAGTTEQHLAPVLRCDGLRKRDADQLVVDGESFLSLLSLLSPRLSATASSARMAPARRPRSPCCAAHGPRRGGGLHRRLRGWARWRPPQPSATCRKSLPFTQSSRRWSTSPSFGLLYGLEGTELQARIAETLAMVGPSDRGRDANQPFRRHEAGRGGIMAAELLHQPELLVLDEPTVGVDPESRDAILETVGMLGIAVLDTTHSMEEAARLCDRIGVIDDGHLIAEGTADGVIDAYGGRDTVHLRCDGANQDALAPACPERGMRRGTVSTSPGSRCGLPTSKTSS